MNEKQLLVNRKWDILNDDSQSRVTWYSPSHFLESFKSVDHVELWNTTSSAGDWEGFILQKIQDNFYLIPFSQENRGLNKGGYTLYTGNVLLSWKGEIPLEEVYNLYDPIYKEGF